MIPTTPYAKDGPYTMVIAKGRARGANVVTYKLFDVSGCRWATVSNHEQAVDILHMLNEEYALWCMVRGTAAEKEHFP